MTELEYVQNRMLEKLGYHVAPFHGDYTTKYVSIKDDEFHFMDGYADNSCRELDSIKGDILLRLDKEGFHYCPSKSEEGEVIKYIPMQYEYYFLRENNKYIEVKYLDDMCLSFDDRFEVVETDNYIAIKYNKYKMSEQKRLEEKPFLDCIISKTKDIAHIGVFVYYYEDKIVVYGKNDDYDIDYNEKEYVVVYDKDFNVLAKRFMPPKNNAKFVIWERGEYTYILYPNSASVYDLTECEYINLYGEERKWWQSVMTYKDVFVFYTEWHYSSNVYDWEDEDSPQETPIKNTVGQVYDSHFNLLRDFNVKGEFYGLMELDDSIVIRTYDSKKNKCFLDVRTVNKTQYDAKDNEHYSIPDITIIEKKLAFLHIARTRDMTSNEGNDRYGVYINKKVFGEEYSKFIDCKYDSIDMFSLKEDKNDYIVGVTKTNDGFKSDFYVNDILLYQGIPSKYGNCIRTLKSGYFINVTDSQGKNRIIRKRRVVFSTKYEVANAYVQKDIDADGFDIIGDTCLIVVTKDDLYGIYSSTGKMLLPIEYSTIDIDEYFNVVLGKKDLDIDQYVGELKDVYLKSRRNDEYMQIGKYSKEFDVIDCRVAEVHKTEVQIWEDYYWDDGFVDLYEEEENECGHNNTPSDWDDYSYEDSLYDALGGEMDAIWNID